MILSPENHPVLQLLACLTPPFPRLVLTFRAPVVKVDSSGTSSNWGTFSSKPFFPGHTHNTNNPLLLVDVPDKSALAVLFPVLWLAFAVPLHMPPSSMNIMGVSLEYCACTARPSFRHIAVSLSDLADVTFLAAFFQLQRLFHLLPSSPANAMCRDIVLHDIILIHPTGNFQHIPKLNWCNTFCNETNTYSWLSRHTRSFQVSTECNFQLQTSPNCFRFHSPFLLIMALCVGGYITLSLLLSEEEHASLPCRQLLCFKM